MLRGLEGWHFVVIALVVLILFGSKKLPDAARSLGRSMRILKAETKGLRDDDTLDRGIDDRPVPPTPPAQQPPQQSQQSQHVPLPLPPGPETARVREANATEIRRDEH